ncbi:hypothetical protein BGP80_19545 [Pseudomonas putida]|uniref:Uncharacterized protein n=1 Tax=Pseudomonas putida TaxID=303 RepID=A0A2S3WGC6_PSEPU|nr:hypothetical protein BGP80_19545 [Pseudomonas putida]
MAIGDRQWSTDFVEKAALLLGLRGAQSMTGQLSRAQERLFYSFREHSIGVAAELTQLPRCA